MNSFASTQYTFETPTALPYSRAQSAKPCLDDLYPRVLEAILDQRITTASRFTEESLGQMFGASRSQIRRVLTQLSHEQVVILRTHHRPQVAMAVPEQTRQILHARRLTETTLIQLASLQRRPDALKALRDLIEQQRRQCARGQRGAAIRLSGEFHLQLARLAGNAPLAHFLGSLVPMTSLAIAQCGQLPDWENITRAHVAIVDAMERTDVSAAVRQLSRHLADLERHLLSSAA
jgi:DNA-binding GntR family transcriptional regulator